MDQYRNKAFEIIEKYYYALPNNGYLNHGLLSCEKRYKEAIQCALICVDEIIHYLEIVLGVDKEDFEFWQEVKQELIQIQANNRGVTLDELKEVFKK
jgi:hypothetical protein